VFWCMTTKFSTSIVRAYLTFGELVFCMTFEIIMDDYVFKELSPIIFSKGRGCVGQMMASYILQDLFICI
jgi:hypothetical protein